MPNFPQLSPNFPQLQAQADCLTMFVGIISGMLSVLHCSSECVPLVKTGGLADVTGALPAALRQQGIDARIAIPGYRVAREQAEHHNIEWLDQALTIEAGGVDHYVGIGVVEIDQTPIYVLANDELFDRAGIYGPSPSSDYEDNARRFAVFNKACLALPQLLQWTPHIIHAHDWQCGMIPALMQRGFLDDFPATRTIFTIHNMAYQGQFPGEALRLFGLDGSLFNGMHCEHFGALNCLKAGVVFADRVTTVSQQYAQEICTTAFGHGLDGTMQQHQYKLSGITNGIDTKVWNPRTDPHIANHFSAGRLAGKAKVKAALRTELGLRTR